MTLGSCLTHSVIPRFSQGGARCACERVPARACRFLVSCDAHSGEASLDHCAPHSLSTGNRDPIFLRPNTSNDSGCPASHISGLVCNVDSQPREPPSRPVPCPVSHQFAQESRCTKIDHKKLSTRASRTSPQEPKPRLASRSHISGLQATFRHTSFTLSPGWHSHSCANTNR